MDITSLYNVSSGAVKQAADANQLLNKSADNGNKDLFAAMLNSAVENIHTANSYMSDAENEKIKFALGETENSHDLTIALQKSSTALNYTVAVRDKFLEAYKEIMNIQI